MFHLMLSIPAFLHPFVHYHNRYDFLPSYNYGDMTFNDNIPYYSYYDEMGFNNYSAEDRAWRRSYYNPRYRNPWNYNTWNYNPWNYNPWNYNAWNYNHPWNYDNINVNNGRYNGRYNNRGYHWRNRHKHNRRKRINNPHRYR